MSVPLTECQLGVELIILSIDGDDTLSRQLMQSGFLPQQKLIIERVAPFFKDPIIVSLRDHQIALTRREASRVIVEAFSE